MFKRVALWILFIVLISFDINGQSDQVGSGRAIRFDGINDYIDLGNIYDDLTYPFTISAWIYLEHDKYSPIFASQDNSPIYNGFQFVVSATTISIEYGDGRGENSGSFRRGKAQTVSNILNRWVHVAAIIRGPIDMDLFLNGVNIGGNYVGSSPFDMNSNFPGDVAKIGYWYSNNEVFNFKGIIDELRLYNRSLAISEIREVMCKKLVSPVPGIIGYWTFDELSGSSILDKSNKGFNGVLMNEPTRVFSGAPLGDESTFQYLSNWTGVDLALEQAQDRIVANNFVGNPNGVHLYVVNDFPSQTGGVTPSEISKPYFGVFAASLSSAVRTFDLRYELINNDEKSVCEIWRRVGNDIPNWGKGSAPSLGVQNRIEVMKVEGAITSIDINLGEDITICPFTSKNLSPVSNPRGFSFKWQDGSKQPTFLVTDYGKYWVSVSNGCVIGTDTLVVTKPEIEKMDIDLGVDEEICPITSRVLQPLENVDGYDFTWHDGSKQPTFLVTDYGKYWVSISDACSLGSDTLVITRAEVDLTISLGEDAELCPMVSRELKPLQNSDGFDYTWHDGSKQTFFQVTDYGKYWVTIKNDCVIVSDTILFTKKEFPEPFIANVLTPNNDQFNDNFMIDEGLLGSKLFIYNRWGKLIYQSLNYQNDWAGGDLPSGVYYYLLRGECLEEKKGWLSIIR
jgi:gliding motility-associated-like protein